MNNLLNGEGISISHVNGNLMITNTMPNRNTFKTIRVLNTELSAKHPVDTLVLSHDKNINIEVDSNTNQLSFSLNGDEICSNVNSSVVTTEIFKIKGDLDTAISAYSELLNLYHKKLEEASILRNSISALSYQDATLDNQLLSYDTSLAILSRQINELKSNIDNPNAKFTYNLATKQVKLDRPFLGQFILENLTTDERNYIFNPSTGRLIFNITDKKVQVYNGQEWVSLH
jgi:hypothetical protein